MKKSILVALALLIQMGAMAQVNVLKEATSLAKTDADKAETMVKSAVSAADVTPKDAAAAYNALVQAYYGIYDAQSSAQILAQIGKGDNVDEKAMNTALYKAFKNAQECDKYDAMPDAKGKIKPKFRKSNCEKLFAKRPQLVNAGLYFFNAKDLESAKQAWSLYLDCNQLPLYETKKDVKDELASQCAYFITLAAYNTNDATTLNKYVELAKTDPEQGSLARELEVGMFDKQYKETKDMALLDQMYAKAEESYQATKDDKFFDYMMSALQQKNDEAVMAKALDDFIAKNPTSTVPYLYKGNIAMNAGKNAEAVANYEKVAATNKENIGLFYNIAVCYRNLASELAEKTHNANLTGADKETFNKYLTKAAENFEVVRTLDPKQETVKYAYLLYSIYSNLNNTEKANEIKTAFNIAD